MADGDLEVQVKDAKAPLDVGHNFELDSVQVEPEPSNENSTLTYLHATDMFCVLTRNLTILASVISLGVLMTLNFHTSIDVVHRTNLPAIDGHSTCKAFELNHNGAIESSKSELQQVELHGFYGMLGNRIQAVSNMIEHAFGSCCDIALPVGILDGWDQRSDHKWRFVKETCNASSLNGKAQIQDTFIRHNCTAKDGETWFRYHARQSSSACIEMMLREYFSVNRTYALGRTCPQYRYRVVHIRAGDLASGHYNRSTGDYVAGRVHSKFALYPTSYYIHALKSFKERYRTENPDAIPQVYVLCQSDANPTCDYFRKTSKLLSDINITIFNGERLLDDVYRILCASEVAVSRGSFSGILKASRRLDLAHIFSDEHVDCKRHANLDSIYWIADSHNMDLYSANMKPWKNTAYQRYLANKDYNISSCPGKVQSSHSMRLTHRSPMDSLYK